MDRRKRPMKPDTGAPPAALPDSCVQMGIFGAAVGLKGEIRLKSYTGDPAAIADYGPLYARDGRSFEITALREAGETVIVRIAGVTDRTGAEALTNIALFVPREALGDTGDEDEFFHADLIGLVAVTETGETLGTVAALYDFGAGEMIEIRPPSGKGLVYPFTKAVVPVVDLDGRRIVIAPPAEIDGDAE